MTMLLPAVGVGRWNLPSAVWDLKPCAVQVLPDRTEIGSVAAEAAGEDAGAPSVSPFRRGGTARRCALTRRCRCGATHSPLRRAARSPNGPEKRPGPLLMRLTEPFPVTAPLAC